MTEKPLLLLNIVLSNLISKLKVFIGKLEKIRSNRISLEVIRVVHSFEPKATPLIKKVILDEQSGYKFERDTNDELYFSLTTITTQIKEGLIKGAKLITLEGEKNFRLIHQDLKKWLKKEAGLSQDQKKTYEKQVDKLIKDYQEKLLEAEKKKARELSS
ncbi:308_t:CDS:2 [Funneliformis geosporum]|uniref:17867_t:CDS:1 n=1 Tax=Funneliformis geosporum TaxID=1117311 RepID=A0A9W4SQ98_9GLOM|nr:17867_t:CDS:2 [Funneliformis geosporum]CAI2183134.1 308_t:CDS:2 [Funneliformis geosporum]